MSKEPARPLNSTIRDLKTTGDFRYKKTPAQLKANLQACVYGLGEMLRIDAARDSLIAEIQKNNRARGRGKEHNGNYQPDCDVVILRWTYGQIKEPGVITRVETVCEDFRTGSTSDAKKARGVLLTREEALVTVEQYLPLAERMMEAIRTKKKAADLPKNYEACAGYGGCAWKKPEISACSPPMGSGFLAKMKQNRLRDGVELKAGKLGKRFGAQLEAVRVAESEAPGTGLVRITSKTTASPSKTPERSGEKKMGLGARFAKKMGTDGEGTVATKPAAVKTAPKPAAKVEEPSKPKVDVKATSDGMAAGPKAGAPAGGGERLIDRLKKLKPGSEAALEKAAAGAQVQAVGESVGKLAVGINPPDVAKEWTQEEQAAESARISGGKAAGAVTGATETKGAVEGAGATGVAKRKPGRPAGSTKAAKLTVGQEGVSVSNVGAATGDEETAELVANALLDIDAIVERLRKGGRRREAGLLLEASGNIAACG